MKRIMIKIAWNCHCCWNKVDIWKVIKIWHVKSQEKQLEIISLKKLANKTRNKRSDEWMYAINILKIILKPYQWEFTKTNDRSYRRFCMILNISFLIN